MSDNSRRKFLKTLTLGVAGTTIAGSLPLSLLADTTNKYKDGIEFQKGFKLFDEHTQKNVTALAETIVPGSGKIDITTIFLNYMSKNEGEAAFYDAGIWNMDAIATNKFFKPFYELTTDEEKKQVIDHIRARNRLFYTKFRTLIVKFYYSHPQVWKKLAYDGPPQPRGFMDYAKPPKAKA